MQLATGLSLMVASGLLAVWMSVTMRSAGATLNAYPSTTAVVEQGSFGFSRNSMYLPLTGLYLGIAISVNGLWVVVLLPAVLISITFGAIACEGSYLEWKFGTAYMTGKSRIRRWF